jgi:hypothetical protein
MSGWCGMNPPDPILKCLVMCFSNTKSKQKKQNRAAFLKRLPWLPNPRLNVFDNTLECSYNECIQWYVSIWLKFGAKLESVSLADRVNNCRSIVSTRNNCCFFDTPLSVSRLSTSAKSTWSSSSWCCLKVCQCVIISLTFTPNVTFFPFFHYHPFFNRCG